MSAIAAAPAAEELYVSLSGIIGAGKSTLADALGTVMNLPVHRENTNRPLLNKFYDDMRKHSFHLQMQLLSNRIEQQQQIKWNRRGAVQDRSIYEDIIFARMLTEAGLMSEDELHTYMELFRQVKHTLQPPHLIVHLDVPPEVALKRIRERGREYETDISLDYLQRLAAKYEVFLQEISAEVRVLRVDWKDFAQPQHVAEAIRREHAEMRSVRVLKL